MLLAPLRASKFECSNIGSTAQRDSLRHFKTSADMPSPRGDSLRAVPAEKTPPNQAVSFSGVIKRLRLITFANIATAGEMINAIKYHTNSPMGRRVLPIESMSLLEKDRITRFTAESSASKRSRFPCGEMLLCKVFQTSEIPNLILKEFCFLIPGPPTTPRVSVIEAKKDTIVLHIDHGDDEYLNELGIDSFRVQYKTDDGTWETAPAQEYPMNSKFRSHAQNLRMLQRIPFFLFLNQRVSDLIRRLLPEKNIRRITKFARFGTEVSTFLKPLKINQVDTPR